ncbi:hypothetical protein GCM10010459_14680 [Microbacterium schleiferi]
MIAWIQPATTAAAELRVTGLPPDDTPDAGTECPRFPHLDYSGRTQVRMSYIE